MQIVFICLNREYCNRVMVASQCELFLQCCGSLSSLIQFADHLQNICSLHSNVNSSEYPLFILLRLNPLSQRKLPIVISLSRMLCFGRVCASPCALNVSTALQGACTNGFPSEKPGGPQKECQRFLLTHRCKNNDYHLHNITADLGPQAKFFTNSVPWVVKVNNHWPGVGLAGCGLR